MLESIRNSLSGIVTWVIVGLIILAFSLWGANGFIFSGGAQNTAAEVNGHKIPKALLEQVFHKQVSSNPNLGHKSSEQLQQMKKDLLKSIVRETAFRVELRKLGYLVNSQAVINNIVSNPAFQVDGEFSKEQYETTLARAGFAEATYQSRIRDALLEQQPQVGILASGFLLPKEEKFLLDIFTHTRDIGYAVVKADELKANIVITDPEVETYYNNNQDSFYTPEKVKLEYLTLSADDVEATAKADISDTEIEEYYNSHISDFSVPARARVKHIFIKAPEGAAERTSGESLAKAEDVLAKIKLNTTSFDDLVKNYSDDPLSKDYGGDLGWVKDGEIEPGMGAAIFSLKQPGDYTEIVTTPFGYHIIMLTDKKEATVQELSDPSVRAKVTKGAVRDLADRIMGDKYDELANLAFEHRTDGVQVVADILELPFHTTEYLSKDEVKSEFGEVAAIQAFSELNESGYNSDPIKTESNKQVVFKVLDYKKPQKQKLEEVSSDIVNTLLKEKSSQSAKKVGEELIERFNNDKSPFEYLKEAKLTWSNISALERTDVKVPMEIRKLAYTIPENGDSKVIGRLLDDGNYAVILLTSVNTSTSDENSGLIERTLTELSGIQEYNPYLNAVINKAKIKYYI